MNYKKREDSKERIEEILIAVDIIANLKLLLLKFKKKFLDELVWKYTEAEGGKYNLKFRSKEALTSNGIKLQHEHVITRNSIINRIIQTPSGAKKIIAEAIGCLVTKEEHKCLNKVPKNIFGWDRYKKAKIRVLQFEDGKWAKFI